MQLTSAELKRNKCHVLDVLQTFRTTICKVDFSMLYMIDRNNNCRGSPVAGYGQVQSALPGVAGVPGQWHCLQWVPAAQLGAAAGDGYMLPKRAAVAQRELHGGKAQSTCVSFM